VLLIATRPDAAAELDSRLCGGGIAAHCADGIREGLEIVGRTSVELVVIATDRLDAECVALLRRLRSDRHTCEVPVVVVAHTVGSADVIQALELGAAECIPQSMDPGELQARLRAAVRTKRRFDELADRAGLDPATGFGNARRFAQRLDEELEVWDRYHRDVSLVLLTLDDFAALECEHGRARADVRLTVAAETLRRCSRSTDVLFHPMRGSFAAVLRETPVAGARVFAERARRRLGCIAPTAADPLPTVGISVGVGSTDGWRMAAADMRGRLLGEAREALEHGENGGDVWAALPMADVA